ncbi:beta-lactamase [Sphaerisporangium krabiense]|uniref:Beta-lactamase n=1 Tax=Sphaerisporangium krabiense TaxID=763782 RepID=A0A7W9DT04_9ACTN|nr:class A beta-lactamase [Sphaerisporangium krabiense]MBB5628915.1 beta-lactamase class A [Sphaerisporangium krabiense]GII60244.1 beta-lactamase [Sphaerisporangium krabiense]
MRDPSPRRVAAALKATGLAISLLLPGAACGTPSASATPRTPATTAPRGTAGTTPPGTAAVAPSVREDPQAPSREADARRRLRALEKSFKGRIGAYAIDTATGRTFAHRSGERFPMLSTFKATAAAAVLDKARTSDPGLMNRVVHWTRAEVKPNSPVTEKHVKDGLTVARLCEAALTRSDNTAANMLLKQIGGPAGLTRYFRALDDKVSRLDRRETELNEWRPGEKRDTTTPAAMAGTLRELTTAPPPGPAGRHALDPRDRARLNAWLRANKTGDTRIRAGLPETWLVGDKTGSSSSYGSANDIAIAHPPGGAPLIMAIYTSRHAADAPYDDKTVATSATILARALGKL